MSKHPAVSRLLRAWFSSACRVEQPGESVMILSSQSSGWKLAAGTGTKGQFLCKVEDLDLPAASSGHRVKGHES